MNKKITIKDIAREAGVSIATVSYVLNNRDDKRISEDTKKKVLQVVNMFNYTCNFSARHISTGKTNIVALYTNNIDFELCCAEKQLFATRLLQQLTSEGYSLRLVEYNHTERLNNVDAIICFDTPTEFFREVGNNNFVPLLSYNNFIDDSLFYQVNTSYSTAQKFATAQLGTSDFEVVSLVVCNRERRKKMLQVFPNLQFVDSFDAAQQIIVDLADRPVLVFDQSLYNFLSTSCKNICIYDPYQQKIQLLVQRMKDVINRKDVVGYSIKV